MTEALYGEHGFYSTSGRAGRRGDFLTSPEVGPLFAAVVARALDAQWRALGEPDDFTVVEVGAGPGTLARGILDAAPACLTHGSYVAVETSAAQRALHPNGITSQAEMPESIAHGVVIANELLDNLPFRLFVFDGEWREASVMIYNGACSEVLMSAERPAVLPARAPHGARAPVQEEAQHWLRDTADRIQQGAIWVFDYCTPLTADIAVMPWREWLRTYKGHERGSHYLKDVGQQDITTQVCLDQLELVREPDAIRTQAQWLQRWGIDDLVEEGKRIWTEMASAPTLAAMKMRSRVSESEALLDVTGLGNFTVVEWNIS